MATFRAQSPQGLNEGGNCERQRVEPGHLPRLAPEFYRGHAIVHWTLTIEGRRTGWLDPGFHAGFREMLIHAAARFQVAAATYVLMPDHGHVLWLGLAFESDQRRAVEYLRKNLRPWLAPAEWQRQVHDHVLTETERQHGSFEKVAGYVLENPQRGELVTDWRNYPFLGCAVAGYPELDPREDDYWERFWRCYNYLIEKNS